MTIAEAAQQLTADDGSSRQPGARLGRLLDASSLSPLAGDGGTGVATVRGRIHGVKVIAFCTDATTRGGAVGAAAASRIVDAIDLAVRERCPVLGLWHSGGAELTEGALSMDGVGQMFAAMIRASGRVPQISVVLGPAAGAAAYGPALTDLVIMAAQGRLFVTGPDVVRAVTGEQIDMEGLGGTGAHGKHSGVVHLAAGSEEAAYAQARQVIQLLNRPGAVRPVRVAGGEDLSQLLPVSARRAYDVHPLIGAILDPGHGAQQYLEFQARWAPNMVTAIGRLGGQTLGVLANNPLRLGGCLDSRSAEKAARFVRMCDSFGVPMLVIVDVPGYLPGVRQEWEGVVRRGAKLLYAFAEAVVPRVTLITRKAYGGAYIAMNSRALGATSVFAWPNAEVAVMSAEAAVSVLHRRKLAAVDDEQRPTVLGQLISDHEREASGVAAAVSAGLIDQIIEPRQTRQRIAEALVSAPAGRGHHGNIPL
jgi:acetyl-CoA/propionyl-CoA carboxylase carboxyl transferase subunit